MHKGFYILSFILVPLVFSATAQKTLKGIVVDSTTLNAVPHGTVKIKNTNLGTLTNDHGVFSIKVKPTDTLIFSSIGYNRMELPVSFDDDVMLVTLSQDVIMLREVTVIGRPDVIEVDHGPSRTDNRSTPVGGLNSSRHLGVKLNMGYFSKEEAEKRKLEEVNAELSKSQTYVSIVTSAEVKKEMMDQFSISDSTFYKILAKFNQKHRKVINSGSATDILTSLVSFFDEEVRNDQEH